MLKHEDIHEWHTNQYYGVERHLTNVFALIRDKLFEHNKKTIRLMDIGANTGKLAEMLERHFIIEEAIFVEPLTSLVDYMKQYYHRPNFHYLNLALSLQESEMFITEPNNENLGGGVLVNGMGTDQAGHKIRVANFNNVPELMNFKPDVIKIDAEGHDAKIIYTMIPYLRSLQVKPIINLELFGKAGYSPDDMIMINETSKALQSMGYNPMIIEDYSNDLLLFV
jgi:FkbM family methyltransferase